MNGFKECSSCEALYTKSCGCLKGGFIDKFVRDPNKTPDSSQLPLHDCLKYGNSVDGLQCRQCALLRKKLKEVWFTNYDEHKFFQDFLNTFESSNDNTNVVNAPQEPFVFNQDPDENSSQSPPHIDHHCCYGCGDSLDGIFYRRCTCESCGNGAHIGYNCPSKVPIISNSKPCHNQNVNEGPHETFQCQPMNYYETDPCYDSNSSGFDKFQPSQSVINHLNLQQRINDSMIELRETFQAWLQKQVVNLDSYSPEPSRYQKIPIYYDDDDDEENEFIKSSVKNLVPNPSESEDERRSEKIYLNPLFDEEIISIKIDPHHFNAESDIIESMLNKDSSIISSSKIDSLLDEFAGELIFLKSIQPRIDEADCDPEEEIRLIEKLCYDNSSPRPPKEFNSENSNAIIKSFSLYPILVEDSDFLMEEIILSLTPDDSMPSGIENDDYDSERDIIFLEEFLSNDSLLLLKNESFHFDIPSSPRPPAKPSDDDGIYFEPDTGILSAKVVDDIFELYVLMPRLLPIQPTLASNEEKSSHLLSHRGFKAFQLSSESPMMIYGGNIPTLHVSFLHFYPP
nr:hypothetical protein [Tanacetum cinerariifolium]